MAPMYVELVKSLLPRAETIVSSMNPHTTIDVVIILGKFASLGNYLHEFVSLSL